MLTTEEEAKTKRCQESFPAATMISADGNAYATTWQPLPPNYGHSPVSCGSITTAVQTAPSMCIGSACMAWRWGEWEEAGEYGAPRGKPTKGFCGKAGRP